MFLDYLTPDPDVLLLAMAANVSRRDTAEAVSAVFIKLGSLTLLFWNAEFEVLLDAAIVFSDELTETSACFNLWFSGL